MTTLVFACASSFVHHSLQSSSSCARQRRHWLRHQVGRDTRRPTACANDNYVPDVVVTTATELVAEEVSRHPSTHLNSVLEPCEFGEPDEAPISNHTVSPPTSHASVTRDVDVVVTHSSADFDSLAAAVGLAKLRGNGTVVVIPGGEGPELRRFLALHRQLFEIVDPKSINPDRLRWVGVVDTVRKDRLGVAAEWPSIADEAVRIWRRNWFACISGATVPKRDEPRG